jgi:hypothetical protein
VALLRELRRQPRLADAGLAFDEDEGAPAHRSLLESAPQGLQLAAAADEPGLAASAGHRRRGGRPASWSGRSWLPAQAGIMVERRLPRRIDHKPDRGSGPRGRRRWSGPLRRAVERPLRQQLLAERPNSRPGDRTELVTQQRPQRVIRLQRLRDITTSREDFHQQRVRGLPERLTRDQRARRRLPLRQPGAAGRQPPASHYFEQRSRQIAEPAPALIEPRAVQLRQQRPLDDLQSRTRDSDRPRGFASGERVVRVSARASCDLDVDPRVRLQAQ